MSDLQRRLDEQRPPQYDREALWDKIERPTRKRRRWFWFFVLGILLLASLTGVYYFEGFDLKITPESSVEVTNEVSTAAIVPQSDNTVQEIENKPVENKTNETDVEVGLTATSPRSIAKDSAGSDRTTVPSSPSTKAFAGGRSLGRKDVAKDDHTILPLNQIADTLNLVNNSLPVTAPSEDLEPWILDPEPNPLHLLPDTLHLLPSLLAVTDPSEDLEPWTLNLEPDIKHQTPKISPYINKQELHNEIELSGGIAYQWHTFDGDNCELRSQEAADPGYYLNLTYKRKLQRQFYLLSAIQYTVHHSSIEASSVLAEQFIDGLSNITIFETTIFYQLYNEYHRLDIGVGAGYTWQKESFDYGVEALLGAAKWLKIDGNYLGENADLQEMDGADALKPALFGRVNGFVSKTLNPQLTVGVNVGVQSPMRLSVSGEACEHWLWPIYMGVHAKRRF